MQIALRVNSEMDGVILHDNLDSGHQFKGWKSFNGEVLSGDSNESILDPLLFLIQ